SAAHHTLHNLSLHDALPILYHEAGGVDVPEVAEKGMGAKAQDYGRHGWPDWHIMGPDGWCGSVVRHTGMFAVTSKMYPLTFLKRSEEHTSELQSHLNLVCRL